MENVLLIDSVPYIILKLSNNEENRSTSTPENKETMSPKTNVSCAHFFQFLFSFPTICLAALYTQKQRQHKEDDCSTLLYPLPWDVLSDEVVCCSSCIFYVLHYFAALYTQKQRLHKEDDCSTLLYPLPWDNPTSANYLFSALLPSHPVKDRSQEIRESSALYTQKQRLHKEDDCSTLLYPLPWDNPTSANYLFSALLPSHPVKDRSQEIRESSALYTQKQRLNKDDDCSTLLYPLPWDNPTSANYLFSALLPCKGQVTGDTRVL
ncbi:hypothetical protein CDAR_198051 [Caerostris darwini]|uniref:Uncharacterized protein n=1 Tax=Caerostris darwini TaxID=1538125 RepID=A0AAV4RDJ2_9ARAC|nr:hypothetical protein CDAR_198051 [Caerostris darwini]